MEVLLMQDSPFGADIIWCVLFFLLWPLGSNVLG